MGRVWTSMIALLLCLMTSSVRGEDPYIYYTWNVTYGTIAPLGVPQQGILINGQFPGPEINSTSNNNVVINVFNNLDEPLLFTWHGVQQRKNSWQDGTLGAQCPIAPGTNYTYRFQVYSYILPFASSSFFIYFNNKVVHVKILFFRLRIKLELTSTTRPPACNAQIGRAHV